MARLRAAVAAGRLVGEVLSLTGLSADEGGEEEADLAKARERILARFSKADGLILVTTDTSAEGLNLHERCHHLLHVELPYNPNRLEQRNGRIDRYGQKKEPVVRYLYLAGTFEERLLLRLVAKWERQRTRLTFVPNTLGVVPGSGSDAVRLLEGIVEEEGLLFTPAGRLDFASGEDEDATSAPYRELLEEVDRAFSGFERAAKTHAWLAESGLGAEASTLSDAEKARSAGSRLASPDLVSFVLDAVRAESGDPNAVRAAGDGLFDLRLPPGWTHGLDELPGWEAEERLLRLTTDPDRTADAADRTLGYLGRAHPIVRRALDRVRSPASARRTRSSTGASASPGSTSRGPPSSSPSSPASRAGPAPSWSGSSPSSTARGPGRAAPRPRILEPSRFSRPGHPSREGVGAQLRLLGGRRREPRPRRGWRGVRPGGRDVPGRARRGDLARAENRSSPG